MDHARRAITMCVFTLLIEGSLQQSLSISGSVKGDIGSNVEMSCSKKVASSVDFIWRENPGHKKIFDIPSSGYKAADSKYDNFDLSSTTSQNSTKLIISQLEEEDHGFYFCEDDSTGEISPEFEVLVRESVTTTEHPTPSTYPPSENTPTKVANEGVTETEHPTLSQNSSANETVGQIIWLLGATGVTLIFVACMMSFHLSDANWTLVEGVLLLLAEALCLVSVILATSDDTVGASAQNGSLFALVLICIGTICILIRLAYITENGWQKKILFVCLVLASLFIGIVIGLAISKYFSNKKAKTSGNDVGNDGSTSKAQTGTPLNDVPIQDGESEKLKSDTSNA